MINNSIVFSPGYTFNKLLSPEVLECRNLTSRVWKLKQIKTKFYKAFKNHLTIALDYSNYSFSSHRNLIVGNIEKKREANNGMR